jgi:hypothetical protein
MSMPRRRRVQKPQTDIVGTPAAVASSTDEIPNALEILGLFRSA